MEGTALPLAYDSDFLLFFFLRNKAYKKAKFDAIVC